jgi:streptomycin 3"-adenylyltransferase
MRRVEAVIENLHRHLERADPGGLVGVYLFGSCAIGGLRPDSDLDVLVLTQHSLSRPERQELTDLLLQFSGRRATVAPGRPLEVTTLVVDDLVPWRYPPTSDFLYGEWLRDQFSAGELPQRQTNPDLAVVVTTARQHAEVLSGPPLTDVLPLVPVADLRRSLHDSLDSLLSNLVGDERNVLLTLARMVVTLRTERIVPKDEAAGLVLAELDEPSRSVLSLAARAYVGDVHDDWETLQQEAAAAARHLAALVRGSREPVGATGGPQAP